MWSLSKSLTLITKTLILATLQVPLLGAIPASTYAKPVPMYPHDSGSGHGRDHGYNPFNHPEENPGLSNFDPNQGSSWPPPLSRLHVPSQQFDFDDSLGTSRLMTPRTRELVEEVGSRRPSRSHAAGAAADTPRRRTHRTGTSRMGGSTVAPPSASTYERGGGSSSNPSYGYDNASFQYSNVHGGMEEPWQQFPEQVNFQPDMTVAFTQMNMQDIPVQGDTSRRTGPGRRSSKTPLEQHRAQPDQLFDRKEERAKWENLRPTVAIPLRLLTADECKAIRLARHIPRYNVALYLEDQFLRNNDIIIGPPVPEPEGWREHDLFKRLSEKDLKEGSDPKLRQTQLLLDEFFEAEGLFKSPEERLYARHTYQVPQAELAITEQPGLQKREAKYQSWSVEHGMLVPLRLMQEVDLASMGLARSSYGYRVGSYIEQTILENMGSNVLEGKRNVKLPKDHYKYPVPMTETHRLPPGTYLRAKQEQVQDWFRQYGYMDMEL